MPIEPALKRAHVFVDGQNLFHAVKSAFGYTYPNYDIPRLAEAVCRRMGWHLDGISFYTGVPSEADNAFWHAFWSAKLAALGTRGVRTESRELRYQNRVVRMADGGEVSLQTGLEKGIDVKMALDVVRMAREGACDVLLLFSQDQDLAEAAAEVRRISVERDRWLKVASAYPAGPDYFNRRGVNGTDWIRIDRELYDTCIDPANYSPPPTRAVQPPEQPGDYTVRRVAPQGPGQDVAALVRLRRAMFTEMWSGSFDPEALAAHDGAFFLPRLERGGAAAWLALDAGGEAVACAAVSIASGPPKPWALDGRAAYVSSMFTAPAHRRRGLARKLFAECLAFARAQGLSGVSLHAAPVGRPLYESFGFAATNEMRLPLTREEG
jgi:GNAT superfamily N-acetyltransferase/uncharacterized LabA/DUF88 family protein